MRLPLRSAPLTFLLPLVAVALWPAAARASAPCVAVPQMRQIRSGATGSAISEPVSMNGVLFFTANDGTHGSELWRSDGTVLGTRLVKDIRLGSTSARPQLLTVMGSMLYFVVFGPTGGMELWNSDGTGPGTLRVAAFPNQAAGAGSELAVLGNTLFFVAEGVTGDSELWKINGMSGATQRVADIYPEEQGSYPGELTVVGDALFFKAQESSDGNRVWKLTEQGVPRQVRDPMQGSPGSGPGELTAVGQLLFFTATSGAGNKQLWMSNGTDVGAGALLVRDFGQYGDETAVTPQSLTAAGNLLFFVLATPDSGGELWVSDGTSMGTRLIKDIQPGADSSDPQHLTAVGQTLFFTASDAVHGRELWRSDGSAGGTRMVRDIIPGSVNPEFGSLAAGPGTLLMELNDVVSGYEPWRSDGTPEGTYRLADVAQGTSASTPRDFRRAGPNLFFVATLQATGDQLYVVPLSQVDCHAPRFDCKDVPIEALSSQGIVLDSPPLSAVDDALTGLAVFFDPMPGEPPFTFPLGATQVSAVASDLAGNSTTCNFRILVGDNTAPLLLCPGDVEQEATSAGGAIASFFVVANDAVTPANQLTVTYSQAPGTLFPVARHSIDVTASDAANNAVTCSFALTIKDTTPPRLECPPSLFRVARREEDLNVSYPAVPVDLVTPSPQLQANYASGDRFPVGETTVELESRDAAGNLAQCSFKVLLVDPQGPSILCPETQFARATSEQGAVVNFPEATATDNLGAPTVSYSVAPGSTFREGETEVIATATDPGGQTASCAFKVQVERGSGVVSGTSCQAGPWSGGLGWLVLVLVPAWARRRAGRAER
ncbi:MAG TPA: ELWxxDGT repeat protein [Myxococcaceae bacterium]|nr:ELWxxDGT repeat protein [Myxococcaceae bacterium]